MPARIDHPAVREQVRLLYIGNGKNLTLAAKTVGIPIDRAEKWKERGKWDEATDSAVLQLSVSESVGRTADNLAKTLSDHSKRSKLGFSKAGLKVAEKLGGMDEDELIMPEVAQSAKQWYGVTAGVHDWQAESQGSGVLSGLQVYSKQTVIQIDRATP